jgi:hypothetical protein
VTGGGIAPERVQLGLELGRGASSPWEGFYNPKVFTRNTAICPRVLLLSGQ